MDYRGEDLKRSLSMKPNIIKPNLSEFCSTFFPSYDVIAEQQDSGHLKQQVSQIMKELYDKYQTMTIITHGSKDLWAYDGVSWYEIPAKKVKAINTIGCGDAFTAGLVHAYINEQCFSQALDTALNAAALNATCITPGSLYDNSLKNFAR